MPECFKVETMKRNRFSLLVIGTIFTVCIIGVCIISAAFLTRQSSESKPIYKKRVYDRFAFVVEVNCIFEKTKDEMESYLKSELRRLGDVEINKEYATHHLYIDTIPTNWNGNMAISYVFLENTGTEFIHIGRHLVNYNPDGKKLSDVCKDLIVGIDVHFLEPIREKR